MEAGAEVLLGWTFMSVGEKQLGNGAFIPPIPSPIATTSVMPSDDGVGAGAGVPVATIGLSSPAGAGSLT